MVEAERCRARRGRVAVRRAVVCGWRAWRLRGRAVRYGLSRPLGRSLRGGGSQLAGCVVGRRKGWCGSARHARRVGAPEQVIAADRSQHGFHPLT
jgi:hypothetical protein